MDSRSLNRIVVIQTPTAAPDAAGQQIPTWATLATVWASILHPSGSESIRADRDVSITRASIRILRRTDVTPAMRVLHGATVYEIKAVLPDEQDRERLDLACEVVHG